MKISDDMIWTWESVNKRGVAMSKQSYFQIRDIMLSILSRKKAATLDDVIEQISQRLGASFKGNLPWYILKVKTDLQARRVIHCETGIGPERKQLIRKNGRKHTTFLDYL